MAATTNDTRIVDVTTRAGYVETLQVLAGDALMQGDKESWALLLRTSREIEKLGARP